MDGSELTLKKPNAALVMIPKSGKLTGVERKLFNSILMSSISQLKSHRESTGKDLDGNHLYSAPADELLDSVEGGKSNLKSALRKHMLSLRRAEVEWEAPDAKTGVIWSNTAVLPRAEIELRGGRLYARWKLSDEVCEAISNTKEFPFTRLDLAQISKLGSYTAVALYEICARYRNNFLKGGDGVCLTSASEPDWWVDALTNILPKIDKKTGLVQRREWRKVKNEAVLKAIDEINEKTDLEVQLIERKTGKAVGLVQFSVRQKRAPAKEIPSSHFELIKTGARLGITQSRIETALESNNANEVSLVLAKFEARVNNSELPAIDKPSTYFSSILKSMNPIDVVADKVKQPVDKLPDPKQDESSERYSAVRDEFMGLSDHQKSEYADQALASLRSKNMASLRMIENANAGVWAPLLLAEMLKLFAKEQSSDRQTI
jgi:plasmid replication initiation protein